MIRKGRFFQMKGRLKLNVSTKARKSISSSNHTIPICTFSGANPIITRLRQSTTAITNAIAKRP
ncbi:hypothetical protein X759_33575 [Mesorhizobium sp. LSHC420B00]|nr:hypothetical protein X759_33575 [Mesorhizobium sp. LSHC420B00]